MAAAKVLSFLCLLMFMPLFFTPGCGNEVCEEWLSDTYRMLVMCSSEKCNQLCVSEGATRGRCGFLIVRSFCYCTKECDES
uniref:Knottin scorpion toxin-like domain-containing protein n=1 Tax=Leersia perrieri TaxID=77586 RepID=A0A0D9XMT1_9ORYZ